MARVVATNADVGESAVGVAELAVAVLEEPADQLPRAFNLPHELFSFRHLCKFLLP
jgi:hypothetical protein